MSATDLVTQPASTLTTWLKQPGELVSSAEGLWSAMPPTDQEFWNLLASEGTGNFTDGLMCFVAAVEWMARGANYRILYKRLGVTRHNGQTAKLFERTFRSPDVWALVMDTRGESGLDLQTFHDKAVPAAQRVILDAVNGEPVTPEQLDAAKLVFLSKHGKPSQRIERKYAIGITFEDLRSGVDGIARALTERGTIIEADFTEVESVGHDESLPGERPEPPDGTVHSEPAPLAPDSEPGAGTPGDGGRGLGEE